MSKLDVTPTGCPGPIAGSKVWRCDGEDCVYGPYQYESCKEAIADRGYTLRMSNDLKADVAEAVKLRQSSLQQSLADKEQELQKERSAHIDTQYTLAAEIVDREQYIDLQHEERVHLVETLANAYAEKASVESHSIAVTEELIRMNETLALAQEEVATLVTENVQLQDELDAYKYALGRLQTLIAEGTQE